VVFACFRIEQLYQSIVEYRIGAQHALYFSVITEMLIQLRDLCKLAEQIGVFLKWSDEIVASPYYSNITELITFFRDGFCHSHGFHSRLIPTDKNTIMKSVLPGKCTGTAPLHLEIDLSNPYQDDTAIFLGGNRIFLFRHIGRAFEELRASFVKAGIVGSPHWSQLLRQHHPLSSQ